MGKEFKFRINSTGFCCPESKDKAQNVGPTAYWIIPMRGPLCYQPHYGWHSNLKLPL